MEPFLKWAGGKRWLTSRTNILIPTRDTFNNYFEPFLGGGAVFFSLKPLSGLLSDVNQELINSYETIRDNWQDLNAILYRYDILHSSEFYYSIRASTPETPIEKAARFIYLNRTCWNGLYRVNKKGQFNVPIGTKNKVILDSDDFENLSTLLNGVELRVCDFELSIDAANEGDFIFIDPPYTVKHNYNGFVKYNENIFSWDDQIRLRDCVLRATGRGVQVLVLNANHSSIREIYNGVGEMHILDRASVIAGNANARGIYSELAIKCW